MLNPDFRDILSAFNAAHGLPRATGDIDLWVRPSADNAGRVWRGFERFGAPLGRLALDDLATPDVVVQIGAAPRRIDVMTSIDGVDFDAAWPERVLVTVDRLEIPVISRRHLIANKRATGRPQDIADIAWLSGQGET
jgi:hypothetical protein